MKLLFISLFIYGCLIPCAHEGPQTLTSPAGGTGSFKRYERFASRYVDPRNVDVWLPPGYLQSKSRFPVVYMHDGQNLFDPKLAFIGVEWGIDETMTRLIGEGRIREAIIVAVWSTSKRFAEYIPQKPVTSSNVQPLAGSPALRSEQIVLDNYLKFLVTELKPFIDSTYIVLVPTEKTRSLWVPAPEPWSPLTRWPSIRTSLAVQAACPHIGPSVMVL